MCVDQHSNIFTGSPPLPTPSKKSWSNTLEDKWRMWVQILQLMHSWKQIDVEVTLHLSCLNLCQYLQTFTNFCNVIFQFKYHKNWASVRPDFSQFLLQRQFNPLKRSRSQSANGSQSVCLSVYLGVQLPFLPGSFRDLV